jgi:hypothetical protein
VGLEYEAQKTIAIGRRILQYLADDPQSQSELSAFVAEQEGQAPAG